MELHESCEARKASMEGTSIPWSCRLCRAPSRAVPIVAMIAAGVGVAVTVAVATWAWHNQGERIRLLFEAAAQQQAAALEVAVRREAELAHYLAVVVDAHLDNANPLQPNSSATAAEVRRLTTAIAPTEPAIAEIAWRPVAAGGWYPLLQDAAIPFGTHGHPFPDLSTAARCTPVAALVQMGGRSSLCYAVAVGKEGGTVVLDWDLARVVEDALAPFPTVPLEVTMVAGERTLYRHWPPKARGAGRITTLTWHHPLAVSGTDLAVEISALPAFVRNKRSPLPWVVLALGWALTASLTLYLTTLARRRVALETEVGSRTHELTERTDELAAATARAERDRQRLLLVLDHAPVGIWLTERDGHARFVNPALCRALGIDEQRFLAAAHYTDLLDEEVARQALASDAACIAQKTPYHSLETVVRADGERREMEVVKVRILDASSAPTGIVGIAHDITEKRRAQAQERQLRGQMEHTQRLESLGVIAGGVAHDFNNLLTAILGNATLARRDLAPDSPATTHLDRIEATCHRAADLCRQMLAYAGKGRFVVQPVDLSELVATMTRLLEVSLPKGVRLECHLAEALPAVEGDVSQLQQVVMNLVTNAAEAIGEEDGTLTVATGVVQADRTYLTSTVAAPYLAEGPYCFFEVSDTGCGMDTATVEHIFDPFFTTKVTGRGLGMSAVGGIVRGHHGALKVYSEVGKGTSFKILLPATAARAIPLPHPQAAPAAAIPGSGGILVVEDEEVVRDVASRILTRAGYTVLVAEDGVVGVEMFERHRQEIDVVLLDMTMPRMDGEETFQRMRAIDPQVRVVLTSGYDEQHATRHLMGGSRTGFIHKPYRATELIATVGSVLKDGEG